MQQHNVLLPRHAILHNSVLLQHITTSLCVVDVLLHPCYLCMLVRQDTCMLATLDTRTLSVVATHHIPQGS